MADTTVRAKTEGALLHDLMVASGQGFPDHWHLLVKTPAYRQIDNAFPSDVATVAAQQLALCLRQRHNYSVAVLRCR